jgi:hypothetical protein
MFGSQTVWVMQELVCLVVKLSVSYSMIVCRTEVTFLGKHADDNVCFVERLSV